MDFYQIKERTTKTGVEIYPDFKVCRSKDLMVRGRSFYAIWDDNKNLWSTDEYDVQRLVDDELMDHREKVAITDVKINVRLMSDFSSGSWLAFRNYINHMSDNSHELDEQLTFLNSCVKKNDYASKKLSYPLEGGKYEAFDELISELYNNDERAKLEWAIGAIVAGDAKEIQKFIVLYGEGGTGKSTMLNVIQKLFHGYYATFDAKALTSSNNAFATEAFKSSPLVAIQHDGDLSKIEDNTKLNSIISHEEMSVNEKYKPSYTSKNNCFIFIGTNRPVKITDAKSGIIRRLLDVTPSGRKLPPTKYQVIMAQIDFELGAIAHHCLEVYRQMGKNYYNAYRPLNMILQTDVFYNFIESNFDIFKEQDGVTLSQSYSMYKEYCDDALIEFKLPKHKFREEIRNYFKGFDDRTRVNDVQVRNYYHGFITDKFTSPTNQKEEHQNSLVLDCDVSLLDEALKDCLAQYANDKEIPISKWANVKTKLSDMNTQDTHYVKIPENHIVVDFDLTDEHGQKSIERNIEAASKWPSTYSEFSKSGAGVHLHYIFDGDVKRLSRIYSEGIEIKVFTGDSSLRRKLTICNNIPVATINSGLPLKGEGPVINFENVKSERNLRDLVIRNIHKEIHPGTKPSIDFIYKILEDAYISGLSYDLTNMRPSVLAFANNSSHQSDYCIKLVSNMKFKSEEVSSNLIEYKQDELVFFDVEVFPNLFVVVWKAKGKNPVKMINPSASDIEPLLSFKLIGFNCRRYDNHIMYAKYIGYDNEQLYTLSQRIINGSANCMFGDAYNISYTDVYDFASAGNKMSLKKWEIKLGIKHNELGLPWDQPVPEELWPIVAEYCSDDVCATEVVFDHLSGDWAARQILAELSGLTVNDTTNQHTTKIVFGDNKHPQNELVYTDLSIMFPGYKFEMGKSTYRGIEVGEGGYVYAEPGMYVNVPIIDIVSGHPTTIEELNMFGPYTKKYSDLKKGRVAIKHTDMVALKNLLDGKLIPFVENALSANPKFTLKDLSNGLKTALNSAYGLTSAKFDNPFRDPRNIDNIVAKREALFMIDLQFAVQEKGFTVAHIKTDSIKIPNATDEIINFVMDFGKKYGYEFEHEETYTKFCLVNDSVYIAQTPDGKWNATGAQFAHPYVYKTLFTKERPEFKDMCETKSVTTAIYLDMNENLPDVRLFEKIKPIREIISRNDEESYNKISGADKNTCNAWNKLSDITLDEKIAEGHDYHFVGKVGSFCPIRPGCGGGVLLREKEGKYYSVGGAKGYRWMESEMVKELGKEQDIDYSYYNILVDDAVTKISKYGDFEWFISEDKLINNSNKHCPRDFHCDGCAHWVNIFEAPNTCGLGYDCIPF